MRTLSFTIDVDVSVWYAAGLEQKATSPVSFGVEDGMVVEGNGVARLLNVFCQRAALVFLLSDIVTMPA